PDAATTSCACSNWVRSNIGGPRQEQRAPSPRAYGERVGVRGSIHRPSSRRVPLTRRVAPTSPRRRGEVKKRTPSHDLHHHTSALPPAKAVAVASAVACSGNSISLWALPEGIIGKQFSSAATRQSNSTGRLTLIISLIAPSRSPGLIACRPTQPKASASLTKSGSASE